jgi:hypothetical protein
MLVPRNVRYVPDSDVKADIAGLQPCCQKKDDSFRSHPRLRSVMWGCIML